MSKMQAVEPPGHIGLVSDGLGLWALWSHDAGDDPETAVRYIRADLHEARIRELEAERDRQYDQNCEQTKRIAELEALLPEAYLADLNALTGEGE